VSSLRVETHGVAAQFLTHGILDNGLLGSHDGSVAKEGRDYGHSPYDFRNEEDL
jgi:hypothetical protein